MSDQALPHVTILGDSQTWKTQILIDMAVDEAARRGGVVWFQSATTALSHHAVKQCVERAKEILDPAMIRRVANTNGRERITFTSGGFIDFDGAEFWKRMRRIQLHCMDQVGSEPYPRAARTARAVLH